jgi:hypothetical protein
LAYEPSNVVHAFGLEDVVSEATVVVIGLLGVGVCGIRGEKALRSRGRENMVG